MSKQVSGGASAEPTYEELKRLFDEPEDVLRRRREEMAARESHPTRVAYRAAIAELARNYYATDASAAPLAPPLPATQTITGRAAAPIGIDAEEKEILMELRRTSPRLQTTYELEASTRISRKTVGIKLNHLIALGLATRPNGQRGGATITGNGELALSRNRKRRTKITP